MPVAPVKVTELPGELGSQARILDDSSLCQGSAAQAASSLRDSELGKGPTACLQDSGRNTMVLKSSMRTIAKKTVLLNQTVNALMLDSVYLNVIFKPLALRLLKLQQRAALAAVPHTAWPTAPDCSVGML